MTTGPKSKLYGANGGHPEARTASSNPQRCSAATPGGWITWVESESLGNVARSTSSTLWPARASSMAVGAPAHRAPTTIASYIISPSESVVRIFSAATPAADR